MTTERPDAPSDPADDLPHAGHSQPTGTIEPLPDAPAEPPPLAPRPLPRSTVRGPSAGAPAPEPGNSGRPR